jgi:hypothetical protein
MRCGTCSLRPGKAAELLSRENETPSDSRSPLQASPLARACSGHGLKAERVDRLRLAALPGQHPLDVLLDEVELLDRLLRVLVGRLRRAAQ